ncbi:helix-turn-helix domain-containing protein [Flavobacterium terrigena]|uniref:Helix-turn-helix n=1 Tax=Flavobacterium terrigena TaxID=402734 RepID=A0A1H6W4M1_9FLAO|nr:helix-turn-helix transcriptional regulator [Flavobacterium terrigena]SEJ11898.1 Helix-turn-helix [Flavobacterium terrigena]
MINTDDFVKRLETIFDYYGLTASSFADKINVQRSSISHLLSGRNKPSLDFILKVIENFPDVELLWLLNGKGNFPKGENYNPEKMEITPIQKNEKEEEINSSDLFSNNVSSIENEKNRVFENISKKFSNTEVFNNPTNALNNNSDIEQIVIFYKDGTFKTYSQKNPNLK